MDHNERDRRDPPDAEQPAPVADERPPEQTDTPAAAEIESWPSQDATAAPEPAWPTEPPAARSAAADDWPTAPPERGDEPILAPGWSTTSDRDIHDDAPPPSEVEAYPAPAMPPRDADPDVEAAAAGSGGVTAAHAVPAGEGAIGESTQCPRCGTENRPGLAFCRNCGQRLVAAGVASTVERPGAPEGTMACPRCGTHNRAGVAFCQNCGANLRGTAPGYVPPAVAPEADIDADHVERRGAILGPVVLLIGLVGIITGYLLPFLYGSGSLYERAMGPGGYGIAFWSGYPDVTGGVADQAYFGLAGPIPILGALLLILAIAGFMRAVPGPIQTVGLGIALLWSVGLIVLFVVVELAANWSGDLVGMLRVLTPAGIIFFLSSLIVLIGTLTRFGRS
ncbi:MAG: zinc ribbon domain-containing protein [Chloroflexota bacterium]|nr:zinc ribbon domain-containing protein [Chloroflexota bacterium]